MTHDHKPNLPKEKERITAHKGRVLRGTAQGQDKRTGVWRVFLPGSPSPGLATSRSFGDSIAKRVGVTSEVSSLCTLLSRSPLTLSSRTCNVKAVDVEVERWTDCGSPLSDAGTPWHKSDALCLAEMP